MNKPKHTPGPWINNGDNGAGFCITKKSHPYIAHVRYSDNTLLRKGIAEANAHLIAAAPDMLQELEGTVTLIKELNNINYKSLQKILDAILSDFLPIIAKAKGEKL